MTSYTVDLPPNASPRVVQAIESLLACVRGEFTGNLQLSFTKGDPVSWGRDERGRFPAQPRSSTR